MVALIAALLASGVTAVAFTTLVGTDGTTTTAQSDPTDTATQPDPIVTATGSGGVDWGAVASAVEPSVVSVQVTTSSGGGEGSGVILDTEGHILTNNHVVADAGSSGTITVVMSDQKMYEATVVGADSSTDLAVIKLSTVPDGLKPATFGDSDAVEVGDGVMAAGNPLGLSDTVTTGIVSALNRPVVTTVSSDEDSMFSGSASDSTVVTNAIQTDAAINPGNSGGALVDTGGRVIGITSSIASLSSSDTSQSGSIGLGFAIPSNEAKMVADQLVESGTVEHAFLGVTLKDGSVSLDGATQQAAVIQSVTDGSPAADAGIEAGDAIIAIDGSTASTSDYVVGSIRALSPGTSITLTIVRDGSTQDLKATLTTKE